MLGGNPYFFIKYNALSLTVAILHTVVRTLFVQCYCKHSTVSDTAT
jgi:hypothetical protein